MHHFLRQATLELHCGAATSTWRCLSAVSSVDRDSPFALRDLLKALFIGTIVQMMAKRMSHSRRDLSWEGLDFLPFAHGSVALVRRAHLQVTIAHGLKCQSQQLTVAELPAGRWSMFAWRSNVRTSFEPEPFICMPVRSRFENSFALMHMQGNSIIVESLGLL